MKCSSCVGSKLVRDKVVSVVISVMVGTVVGMMVVMFTRWSYMAVSVGRMSWFG